jgi:hypothetical protein
MGKPNEPTAKRLHLRIETLRNLKDEDLTQAQGGTSPLFVVSAGTVAVSMIACNSGSESTDSVYSGDGNCVAI